MTVKQLIFDNREKKCYFCWNRKGSEEGRKKGKWKKEQVKIKEEKDIVVIKEEKQTDGSCDRTSASEEGKTDTTDETTDATDSDTKPKKCRRKLNKEFLMFAGDEKKIVKLVEIDSDENTHTLEDCTDSGVGEVMSETGTEEKSSNTESDSNSTEKTSDSNSTEEKSSNAEKSNGVESSVSKSETDSVYKVPVKKKQIPLLELDKSDSSVTLFEKDKSDDNNDEKSDSSEKSDSTTKIYKKFMEGDSSKISLPTVSSTFSTVAYSDSSSDDVKVLKTDEEDLKKNSSKNDIKVPETDDEDLKKNS